MGLEELFAIPVLIAIGEETTVAVAAQAAAFAGAEAAAGAAGAAAAAGATLAAEDAIALAATEALSASMGPTVAGEMVAATAAEAAAAMAAEAVSLTEPLVAEAWPLTAAWPVSAETATAQLIFGEETTMALAAQYNVEAGMAADALIPWTLPQALGALNKLVPGSEPLLASIAEGKLNMPALLQTMTSLATLLGPLGPGVAKFLQLHSVTANKHIPAALATMQLIFGKLVAHPTTKDKGIILDVSQVKTALGALGVRFSEEEELADQQLVTPLGNVIEDSLKDSTTKIADMLNYHEQVRRDREDAKDAQDQAQLEREIDALDARRKEQRDFIVNVTNDPVGTLGNLLPQVSAIITDGVLPEAERVIKFLSPFLTKLIALLADTVVATAKIAHEPISDALTPIFQKQLSRLTDELSIEGQVSESSAIPSAGRMFSRALEIGVFAHALASVVELAHPTKELGISNLAAAFTDLAAFGPIAQQTVGQEARMVIGEPFRRRMNRAVRPTLPGIQQMTEMYLEHRLAPERYKDYLQMSGWPDDLIDVHMETVWREPPPRELAIVYEDAATDPAWILSMIREQGYTDADAEILARGVVLRSQKSLRSGYLNDALSAYADGALTSEGLDVSLEVLGLRDESRQLVHQRAGLRRAHQVQGMMLTQYRTMVKGQVLTLEDFRVSLAGLGMDEQVVTAEVAAMDVYLRGQVAKDEKAEIKVVVRREQALAADIAEKQVRLGTLTVSEAQAVLEQYGIHENQARLMATLAGLKTLPVPKLPEVLSQQAAEQQILELQTNTILNLVSRRLMDGPIGLITLVGMGVEYQEATAKIALAVAKATEPPKLALPPKESAEAAEVRRIKTQEALAAFRGGLIGETQLVDRLRTAGHSEDVVQATIERERTTHQLKAEAEIQKLAEQMLKEALKASEQGQ